VRGPRHDLLRAITGYLAERGGQQLDHVGAEPLAHLSGKAVRLRGHQGADQGGEQRAHAVIAAHHRGCPAARQQAMRGEHVARDLQHDLPERIGTGDPAGAGAVIHGEVAGIQDGVKPVLCHHDPAANRQVDHEVIAARPPDSFRRTDDRVRLRTHRRDP
jgi:hypothetical protein